MSNRFNNQQFVSEPEDSENSPENSAGDSPRSAVSADTKLASTSSSKKSRRAVQKRVVSVAIKDVEGFRLKGDQMSAPPSDSWAWRKYGQKPIKGSPYPRGYYRCSSSKGCPARKQVERSRTDSKMLVITYYCEHNHPWPASRNHRSTAASAAVTTAASAAVTTAAVTNVATPVSEEEEEEEEEEEDENKKHINLSNINNSNSNNNNNDKDKTCHEIVNPDYRYSNLSQEGQISQASEFGWLSDLEFTNCGIMLESPILSEDIEMATIFTMREEDEPLFADLGELPECSAVFRRGMAEREAEQRRRRPGLATTG